MVPLRSATTLLGRPALISDCAPMMLRVRPAQFTTTSVSGDGAMSRMRSTSSAPGTLVAVGIETRWNSSNGRLSTTTMSVPLRISASSSSAEMLGVRAGVLDVLAERLARHVDAGEQLEAGLLPAGDAAFQDTTGRCSRRRPAPRRRVDRDRRRRRSARCRVAWRGTRLAKRSSSRLSGTDAPRADGAARRSAPRAGRSAPVLAPSTSIALRLAAIRQEILCQMSQLRLFAVPGLSLPPRRSWHGRAPEIDMAGTIGERSDAVLQTAMAGHDDEGADIRATSPPAASSDGPRRSSGRCGCG